MRARPSSPVLLALLLPSLLACKPAPATSTPTDAGDQDGDQPEPDGDEVSVRPGVNDKYFADGAVKTWTDTLEGERREVIAHRDEIVGALELKPGMVVADVGAGTGAFLEPLALAVGPEGKLYAVDIVPSFLEHLRRRADEAGLGNVEVVAAGERDVMLPADSVDLLFVCDVYHHLEYPAAYLRTLHRALRADGRLVIVEFDKVPGKTTPGMMKHVRQDRATLLQEVGAEGFVLEREVDSVVLDENYMLVFRK